MDNWFNSGTTYAMIIGGIKSSAALQVLTGSSKISHAHLVIFSLYSGPIKYQMVLWEATSKDFEPFLCRFMNAQQTAPTGYVSVKYQTISSNCSVEHCTVGCFY